MPTPDATRPPTGDALALALTRLGESFTAVSALTDAVDALPPEVAGRVRPSTAAAFGALTEAEGILTVVAAGGAL